MSFQPEDLAPLSILQGLPREPRAWLAAHGVRIELAAGERMFRRGQPADFMFLVVSGTIQRYEEIGGQWLVVATTTRGQVTGMLPYSRMTHYPGHAVAVEPSEVLRVGKDEFDGMLGVSHELGQRLVAEMSNRVRGDVRLEQQRDKMMALGRLSAGLAHELNNPAAAIRRTIANLEEQLARRKSLLETVVRRETEDSLVSALDRLTGIVRERTRPDLPPLDLSEREDEIASWLENRSVAEPWDLASALTGAGFVVEDLETLLRTIPDSLTGELLTWIASDIEIDRMVTEITSAATRISDLVSSVKTYSHMDRSSEHKPTDVRNGLDNTLTMLGHRLKAKGIRLTRDYPDDLPLIPGHAGELNQVWTNLIDNAIDAMDDGGELSVAAGRDDWGAVVKIVDNGRGIPEEIRERIFDPFFTTKDVGEGTGLGLDIARRIVRTHQGQIDIHSKPGRTEVVVRLPVATRSHPSSSRETQEEQR